jgi:hypothetical protein
MSTHAYGLQHGLRPRPSIRTIGAKSVRLAELFGAAALVFLSGLFRALRRAEGGPEGLAVAARGWGVLAAGSTVTGALIIGTQLFVRWTQIAAATPMRSRSPPNPNGVQDNSDRQQRPLGQIDRWSSHEGTQVGRWPGVIDRSEGGAPCLSRAGS